jgi:hypothetical protein
VAGAGRVPSSVIHFCTTSDRSSRAATCATAAVRGYT